jgi:Zn-finger nucleic acid-binding protein
VGHVAAGDTVTARPHRVESPANCARCDLIWLDFGEIRRIVDAPGRDRGSRDMHRLDDEYVRRGPDGADNDDTEERGAWDKRDPLLLLADLLFR